MSSSAALSFLAVSVVSFGCLAAEPGPNSWPGWRGPVSAGSTPSGSYASGWADGKNILWTAPLPGKGCSTPVVWGDRIFITVPIKGEDGIMAFDWKGKVRWQSRMGKTRGGKHRNGSGANPSPVTDGKYIFAYYRSGNFAGLDVTGKVLWKTNLQKRFGEDTLYWDIGTSPVVTARHAVIAVIQERGSFLAAFDKKSGELAWKVARNYECPTEGDHSYTTPIVVRHEGREAILVWGAERLTLHSAADGKIIWSCAGFNPEEKRNWVTVASPVISAGVVVVPYGRGERLAGVKLGGKGDVTATHRLWTVKGNGTFVPTPAVSGDEVYILRDKGQVVCLDSKTGKTKWSGRMPKHRAKYYSSPLVAGGNMYAAREDGVVVVARLGADFKVLSENDMGERMIASPVPVAGRLLLRGDKALYCIAKPGETASK
ncbi:MAG: PQQ-binding-like beta-propeller repeat protein [Planctomycetota bacterium]|jgi:outer membrane protein assembly factor BamB|nr:PQQ-binding-like beta-propeller repeat protein [Planctomycetota bacterium]